jgi:asparagine synthase (glutamine-hydrolysing)
MLIAARGKRHIPQSYWNLAECFYSKQRYNNDMEAVEKFLSLFEDAVRMRMISDVPLGAFLSGGLDSSAIVWAMMQNPMKEKLKTFSIGFKEKGYSELDFAGIAAADFNTDHKEKMVTQDAVDELFDMSRAVDEPFADTSFIAMYELARYTRSHVTVALSGDGGDEAFSGYPTYVADKLRHGLRWIPPVVGRTLYRAAEFWPADYGKVSLNYKLKQFLRGINLCPDEAHFSWRRILEGSQVFDIIDKDFLEDGGVHAPFEIFAQFAKDVDQCHYLDRAMYVDIKTWLADDILVKVDRSTMAHGLEARAPFLDYRLIEFAARLPVEYRLKGLNTKYLLKKSMQGRIPDRIIHRKKEGFNAPVAFWLTGSMSALLKKIAWPYNPGYIRALHNEHLQRRRDNSLPLLAAIMFSLWRESVLA